jgi:hypothetical protein
MTSKGRRRIVTGVCAAAFALGAIAAAHAPFARPWLMRLGGCPVASARMTPVEAEAARHLALKEDLEAREDLAARDVLAPSRPALGFALDATTLDEARAWARRASIACDDVRPGLLRCERVPPQALGRPLETGSADELELEFDDRSRLVNLTTVRSHLSPAAASEEGRAIVASLGDALGPAVGTAGDFATVRFAQSATTSISTVRYRYRDYVADVTGMNAPSGGPSIREHYMSARD